MSRYNVMYPPKGRQLLDGGKNSKFERSIIAPNESPDCANVIFSNGAVETRGGVTKLNTTAVGSYVIDGIYTRRDNTGAETMIVAAGGSFWQLGTTTFTTISSGQSVYTAGQRVAATQAENHIFFGDGAITPYKYNGVAFTRHGVPQATGSVTAASITTSVGVINGEARYKIAYVNSASVYGDVGTATTTLTVTNGKVYLTGIPTAPQSHGVNARRIYRNFVSGATGSYALVATLSDNTTTTYVDNALDAALTTAAPSDNGEPPKYSSCIYHQGRLWCNDAQNPNYVWYSELYAPYTFGSTNFIRVGDASGDLVKGVAIYEGSVVVLCESSPHLIVMPDTTPSNWAVVRVRSEFGSKSPFSAFNFNNKLGFAATSQGGKFVGIAAISGTTIDPEASRLETQTAGSDRQSDRIEPDMFQVQESYLGNISSIVFKNKAYIAVTYGTSNTTNNRAYLMDFSISNLSKTQEASWVPITGINPSQFTIYGGNLYFGDATATGFVRKLETTSFNDDSSAIDSYFWTKEFSGLPGHESYQKDFRKVVLLVERSGSYYMNITYRVDSDSGVGTTKQIDLTPNAATWNNFNWGAADWGAGNLQDEITLPLGQITGKRIQFKFSNQNTANQKFKIHGLNFTYNIRGMR